MKILISGSSGFLGTIIHEHLIKNNTVLLWEEEMILILNLILVKI